MKPGQPPEVKSAGQLLGLMSWEARSKGKTKKQRSEMMSKLAKDAWKKRKKLLTP